jgi:hypothetical protein
MEKEVFQIDSDSTRSGEKMDMKKNEYSNMKKFLLSVFDSFRNP